MIKNHLQIFIYKGKHMKLKELITTDDELHHNIHRNYNDFVDNNIPSNSIELDKKGRIISNKTSLLRYIDFLLTQVEYCPESNNNKEFKENGKKKKTSKKKLKDIPYNKLSTKQKRERIKQNTSQFSHGHSNYPDEYSAKIP